jgi:hypothetical protein
MNEKTKRILIRRRIREVITVKQPKTFVCEHCGTAQTFKLADNANNKLLTKGDNTDENNNKQL